MRHRASVVFGGWLAFFLTAGLTSLLWPFDSPLVPLGCGLVATILLTPALHVQLRAFGLTETAGTN